MLSLLNEKMFSDITISELTKKAGIVRNTFYAHFERKEDILTYYLYEIFKVRIQQAAEHNDINEVDFALLYFEICTENIEFLSILEENHLLHMLSQFGDQFNLICEEFDLFGDCNMSKEAEKYANTLYADTLASIIKRWMVLGRDETPKELCRIFKEFIR